MSDLALEPNKTLGSFATPLRYELLTGNANWLPHEVEGSFEYPSMPTFCATDPNTARYLPPDSAVVDALNLIALMCGEQVILVGLLMPLGFPIWRYRPGF